MLSELGDMLKSVGNNIVETFNTGGKVLKNTELNWTDDKFFKTRVGCDTTYVLIREVENGREVIKRMVGEFLFPNQIENKLQKGQYLIAFLWENSKTKQRSPLYTSIISRRKLGEAPTKIKIFSWYIYDEKTDTTTKIIHQIGGKKLSEILCRQDFAEKFQKLEVIESVLSDEGSEVVSHPQPAPNPHQIPVTNKLNTEYSLN